MPIESLPRLLVVDDDPTTIQLLAAILDDIGRVQFATDGAMALERVRQARPDLVLLDAQMPGMDGFAACAAIHALPGCADLPILFLTADADPESEIRALGLGAVDFIHKPISPPVVRARVNTHLALKQRTDELQAANRNLQSLVERLRAFTYAASHDLKGPLRRMSSFSSLLAQHYRDRLEGDGLHFLDFIQGAAARLTELVDDLLAYAQMEQQAHRLQPVPLRDTTQSVLHEKRLDIEEQGGRIGLDLPEVTVLANPASLRQVLRNLIDNAVKYADPSTPLALDIGATVHGNRCHVWVRDNGIGFDMADHDRIFEIFHRLHRYEEIPGSGIGLALVKKAMADMQGRVWAESRIGQGATFFLELQASPLALPEERSEPVAA